MNQQSKPIFVVGATGRHGATGNVVVRELLNRGIPVRALARVDDVRAQALRTMGAEVTIGDLHDWRSFASALEGVEAAYFTYPVKFGMVDAAANFAAAARAARLRHVVIMSVGVARPDHPSPFARADWLAEEVMNWAGLSCLNLHVLGFFFENLTLLHRADVMGDGVLRNSYTDMRVPWIAGEDVGKIVTAALLHPERFGGKGVAYPMGTELLSHSEIAELLSRHLGRQLRHETIAKEAWVKRLVELSATDDRISEYMALHISETAAALSKALQLPPSVLKFEALTGEKPLSLASALATGKLSFT